MTKIIRDFYLSHTHDFRHFIASKLEHKTDITLDDSQRRFLAQHSVAMLEQ